MSGKNEDTTFMNIRTDEKYRTVKQINRYLNNQFVLNILLNKHLVK